MWARKRWGRGACRIPINNTPALPSRNSGAPLVRPFKDRRLNLGVNFLVASGYTGQTIENFSTSDISEAVGGKDTVASVTFTYRLGAGKTS